ncbi:MAG: hypothetical protein WCA11_01285, partial [Terracidiphilus sp.]
KSSRRNIKPLPRTGEICAFYVFEIEPNNASCLPLHAAHERIRAHRCQAEGFGPESSTCASSMFFRGSQEADAHYLITLPNQLKGSLARNALPLQGPRRPS